MSMNYMVLNKFDNIFNDFKTEISKASSLCKLRELNFYGDSLPDYTDTTLQKFYLSRYLLAYYVEYAKLYEDLIEKDFIKNDYNILSIGCGCGLDLWGLKKATENTKINYNYTGLDCIKWDYSDFFGEKFINARIENICKLNKSNYNVIMFPKSIGEFDQETFENLKNTIRNSNFNEKNLVLISAHRKSREFRDRERLLEVMEVFQYNHRYILKDSSSVSTHDFTRKLEYINPQIRYPKDKMDFIKYLPCLCKKHSLCGENCDQTLSRYPVNSDSQFCYQIITLTKEEFF